MSEAEHDQADAAAASTEATPEDDVKQKFREALERKQAQRHRAEQAAGGAGKAVHSNGPVGGKRSFRRKSG
jgi:Family of unknown function (DUF5302)